MTAPRKRARLRCGRRAAAPLLAGVAAALLAGCDPGDVVATSQEPAPAAPSSVAPSEDSVAAAPVRTVEPTPTATPTADPLAVLRTVAWDRVSYPFPWTGWPGTQDHYTVAERNAQTPLTSAKLLGTSYAVVDGEARALAVVITDATGTGDLLEPGLEMTTANVAEAYLYALRDGELQLIGQAITAPVLGESNAESYWPQWMGFELTPSGARVYSQTQGQGYQGGWVRCALTPEPNMHLASGTNLAWDLHERYDATSSGREPDCTPLDAPESRPPHSDNVLTWDFMDNDTTLPLPGENWAHID